MVTTRTPSRIEPPDLLSSSGASGSAEAEFNCIYQKRGGEMPFFGRKDCEITVRKFQKKETYRVKYHANGENENLQIISQQMEHKDGCIYI